jgi:molecular chaperone DnaJ
VPAPTHYEILGVSPQATAAEIREAYRRLAREHHPDRRAMSAAVGRAITMPQINEAYRVLHDPSRRAMYDASLRPATPAPARSQPSTAPSSGSAGSPSMPQFPSHFGPARVPWRSLLFFGTLAIVGIVVLAQFTEPGEPPAPDGILRNGDCVEIEPGGAASEVACTGDPAVDLVVRAFVPFDGTCPGGTTAHRDRQGMGTACIAPPPAS